MKNKSFKVFLLLFCVFISLFACAKEEEVNEYQTGEKPDLSVQSGEINLNFVTMHNFVIDSINEDGNPFFFIKDNGFDISGDNETKVITLTCTCLDRTTVEDVDLFLSLVLQRMGINAAEQDYRFVAPKTDDTGTYLDFGSIFDMFDLNIISKTESGLVLHDDSIKKGEKIPIDSRYWRE